MYFLNKDYEYKTGEKEKKEDFVLDKSRKTPYEVEKRKKPKRLTDLADEIKKPTP